MKTSLINITRRAACVVASLILIAAGKCGAYAEGVNNVFEGDYKYVIDDNTTCDAKVVVESTSKNDWEYSVDKINNDEEDNYLNAVMSVKGELGDTITATISSEKEEAYLGVIVMLKVNGKWKQGVQRTLLAKGDAHEAKVSYTIEPNVSEVKITICEHTQALSANRPGCVDINFNVYVGEKQPFEDTPVAISDTGAGKTFIRIIIGLGVILFVYRISKMAAEKRRAKKD